MHNNNYVCCQYGLDEIDCKLYLLTMWHCIQLYAHTVLIIYYGSYWCILLTWGKKISGNVTSISEINCPGASSFFFWHLLGSYTVEVTVGAKY